MKTIPRARSGRSGQVLVLFALFLFILLVFMGLAIDGGFMFVTRANLSKAVDAATLAAIKNLSLGTDQAEQIARDTFTANYNASMRNTGAPQVDIEFTTDGASNTVVNVSGATTMNTFFLGLLPGFQSIPIRAEAQSLRPKLIMSLVLDRSGSMQSNRGCEALPGAVDNFISFFDDSNDRVALVTYASHARLDVSVRKNFKTAVSNAVPRSCASDYAGYTFSDGGLQIGSQQIQSVSVASGEEVVRVAVFFTDGLANTFQGTFRCPDPNGTPTLLNLSGGDYQSASNDASSPSLLNPNTGGSASCSGLNNGDTFTSVSGAQLALTRKNARAEGKIRALITAESIRQAGITVYTIGLGDNVDQDFLREIANDPAGPNHKPNQPIGEFAFAPTKEDLNEVFQEIAERIIGRLSQ